MPGDGTDPDDLPLDDEDFADEDFNEGSDEYQGDGDDTDNAGDSQGGQHPTDPAEAELVRGEEGQVDRPSRAQARVETALREAREATSKAAALEEQIRQLTQNQSRSSAERDEAEQLARLDPYERAEFLAARAERNTGNAIQQLRQEMADNTDKATFAASCAANPTLARVKDEVESTLSEARRNGITLQREALAAYLIGQKILAKAPAARARAGKQAVERVNRERARPANGGSDSTGGRNRDANSARRERLENASI
jgi:hypothetical protein